jgi:hypothetical protein
MTVHCGLWQFRIFADGNADIFNLDTSRVFCQRQLPISPEVLIKLSVVGILLTLQ